MIKDIAPAFLMSWIGKSFSIWSVSVLFCSNEWSRSLPQPIQRSLYLRSLRLHAWL